MYLLAIHIYTFCAVTTVAKSVTSYSQRIRTKTRVAIYVTCLTPPTRQLHCQCILSTATVILWDYPRMSRTFGFYYPPINCRRQSNVIAIPNLKIMSMRYIIVILLYIITIIFLMLIIFNYSYIVLCILRLN